MFFPRTLVAGTRFANKNKCFSPEPWFLVSVLQIKMSGFHGPDAVRVRFEVKISVFPDPDTFGVCFANKN